LPPSRPQARNSSSAAASAGGRFFDVFLIVATNLAWPADATGGVDMHQGVSDTSRLALGEAHRRRAGRWPRS
jgi:hypothetical protein